MTSTTATRIEAIQAAAEILDSLQTELARAQAETASPDNTAQELAQLDAQREQLLAQAFIDRSIPDLAALDKARSKVEKSGADAALKRQSATAAVRVLSQQVEAAQAELNRLQAEHVEAARQEARDEFTDLETKLWAQSAALLDTLGQLHAVGWRHDVLKARLTGNENFAGLCGEATQHLQGINVPRRFGANRVFYVNAQNANSDNVRTLIEQQRQQLQALGIAEHGPALRPNKPVAAAPSDSQGVRIVTDPAPGQVRVVQQDTDAPGLVYSESG